MKKYKVNNNKEIRDTGIGGKELSEHDVLLEELTALYKESEKRQGEEQQLKKTAAETERNKALSIRDMAMERYSETLKRKNDTDLPRDKKSRRSTSDTIEFLREKLEHNKERQQQDLLLKQEQQTQFQGILKTMNEQQNVMQQQENFA